MTVFRIVVAICMVTLGATQVALADNVIEDDGVGFTREELEYIVSTWTPNMQQSAAKDMGDRLELLNMSLRIRKMARAADSIPVGTEAYFRYTQAIEGEKRRFLLQEFVDTIEVPDLSDLAKERYETEKEKYALVAEKRSSSHILFKCATGSSCLRNEAEEQAQLVLDQLNAGADFEEMVQQHSGDPGSKAKGGKFDRWISMADTDVTPPYLLGTFKIEKVGDYSELVHSQFGLHIIRLDGIQEKYFLPYDDVKDQIKGDLETEYRKLALKDYRAQFNISDDAYIDGDAMDGIFSKYGTSN